MEIVMQRFRDLDLIIDQVHEIFEQWIDDGSFSATPHPEMLEMLKLSVHEWMANIIQHAKFEDRQPEVVLDMTPNGKSIYCVIEDNSEGFDLNERLVIQQAALEALPERGMGLLILKTCTDHLTYTQVETGRFRLEFSVSADNDSCLNIPFWS